MTISQKHVTQVSEKLKDAESIADTTSSPRCSKRSRRRLSLPCGAGDELAAALLDFEGGSI